MNPACRPTGVVWFFAAIGAAVFACVVVWVLVMVRADQKQRRIDQANRRVRRTEPDEIDVSAGC